MERRFKIIILLIAFFLDMWVWEFRTDSLTSKLIFIAVFLLAPIFWGLVLDVRGGVSEPPDGKVTMSYSLRQRAPHIAGSLIILLLVLLEVPPLIGINWNLKNPLQIIFSAGLFGFLWSLVIRDLEIGN